MDKETVREEHERLHQEFKDLYKDLALARDHFNKFRQKLILNLIEEKQKQMKLLYSSKKVGILYIFCLMRKV